MKMEAKERKVKDILEKYEKMYSFSISVVGYQGLLIANGFLKNFLDKDMMTAQGDVLLDFANTFMRRVMGQAYVPEQSGLRKHLKVDQLPQRKVELQQITMELAVENYYRKEMEKYEVIITPLDAIEKAFLLVILEKSSNRLIKLDLAMEKRELEQVLG